MLINKAECRYCRGRVAVRHVMGSRPITVTPCSLLHAARFSPIRFRAPQPTRFLIRQQHVLPNDQFYTTPSPHLSPVQAHSYLMGSFRVAASALSHAGRRSDTLATYRQFPSRDQYSVYVALKPNAEHQKPASGGARVKAQGLFCFIACFIPCLCNASRNILQ